MGKPTPQQIIAARDSVGHTVAEAAMTLDYSERHWRNFENGTTPMKLRDYENYIDRTRKRTDIEKLTALLESFGIEFRAEVNQKGHRIILEVDDVKDSNVVGYQGFYTEFNFDSNGKFIEIGIYE